MDQTKRILEVEKVQPYHLEIQMKVWGNGKEEGGK